MPIKPFEPKFMKVGVLTAALQELTPREVRDADPDRAIEEWVEFAGELGASYIQLSSALHPTESDVPPEAMLDPVANTLDLRKPFDKARAVAELSRSVRELAIAGIRQRHPGASERECLLHFAMLTLGREVACRVYPDAASLGDR